MKQTELHAWLQAQGVKSSDTVQVYISTKPLPANNVRDTFGRPVFDTEETDARWLIFVDLCKFANWSHDCTYLLIKQDGTFTEKKGSWMPHESIELLEIPN